MHGEISMENGLNRFKNTLTGSARSGIKTMRAGFVIRNKYRSACSIIPYMIPYGIADGFTTAERISIDKSIGDRR